MIGTIVNTLAVLIGSSIGLLVGSRLPDKAKEIIMQALGLATLLIGTQMALKTENVLIVIGSLVIGGLLGQLGRIAQRLEQFGEWLKLKVKLASASSAIPGHDFVTGFVTASLVFCVGAMTVVGSIQEGIDGNASILYAKSMLDGTSSVAFAASLGVGVAFAAVTVLTVQGLLTLLGTHLSFMLSEQILAELSATGGLLIVAIGLYLLGIKKIETANMLPALVFAVIFAAIFK